MLETLERFSQLLINGSLVTIQLIVVSLSIAFLLALLASYIQTLYPKSIGSRIVSGFIFCIRGTPLLVQLFLVYYGLGSLFFLQNTALWPIISTPFFSGALTLIINSTAYTTVLFTGGIRLIPNADIQAGKVLGLSGKQIFWSIQWPQAWRRMIPAYSNEAIMVLKGTTLVSTIALLDFMGVIRRIISRTYEPVEPLIFAFIFYAIMTWVLLAIFKMIELKFKNKHA